MNKEEELRSLLIPIPVFELELLNYLTQSFHIIIKFQKQLLRWSLLPKPALPLDNGINVFLWSGCQALPLVFSAGTKGTHQKWLRLLPWSQRRQVSGERVLIVHLPYRKVSCLGTCVTCVCPFLLLFSWPLFIFFKLDQNQLHSSILGSSQLSSIILHFTVVFIVSLLF